MATDHLSQLQQKLVLQDIGIKERLEYAKEMREMFENFCNTNMGDALQKLHKVFQTLKDLMGMVPPSLPGSPPHLIRANVLDIFNRVQCNEQQGKTLMVPLINLILKSLQEENEENGILCLRIAFDLQRAFRGHLEEQAGQYCEFTSQVFRNVKGPGGSWERCFGAVGSAGPPEGPVFVKATHSFKVLLECPNQVMWLYQHYPNTVPGKVQHMIPVLLEVLKISKPLPAELKPHQRSQYHDFKMSQIRALNLLVHTARVNWALFNPMPNAASEILEGLANLFHTTSDSIMLRKELLAATRACLTTSLKNYFYRHLPTFLDEGVFLGRSRTCQREMRGLAYSTLAELVHHNRLELQMKEMGAIIQIYCRNVQDMLLPASVQATSMRLLLNLVEVLHSRRGAGPDAEAARQALQRLLFTFVDRLEWLKKNMPRYVTLADEVIREKREQKTYAQMRTERTGFSTTPSRAYSRKSEMASQGTDLGAAPSLGSFGPGGPRGPGPPGSSLRGEASGEEGPEKADGSTYERQRIIFHTLEKSEKERELQEALLVLQTLVGMGLKSVVTTLVMAGNLRNPPDPNRPGPSFGLREEEIRLLGRALEAGLPCLRLPDIVNRGEARLDMQPAKEAYESFAEVFGAINDGCQNVIVEIFGPRMGFLFDAIIADPKLERFVGTLLMNTNVNKTFADLLLRDLINVQFPKLAFPDSAEGKLTLKLLTLFFDALGKMPIMEKVLEPVFIKLVQASLKHVVEAKEKQGYLEMMVALFRTLNAPYSPTPAKFDRLYILFGSGTTNPSMVGPVLTTMRALLDGPCGPRHHAALLELCLIMPARLQDMLQYLPLMMKPVVGALRAGDELVSQALRSLEHWVDSLNPEFLEPAMQAVAPDLMLALWAHLRPPPSSNFGNKVLTILGKLGGRNRRFLKVPPTLEYRPHAEHGLRYVMTFKPGTNFLLPLDRLLQLARNALMPRPGRHDHFLRVHALKLLQICCTSYMNIRSPEDSNLSGTAADKLTSMLFGSEAPPPMIDGMGMSAENYGVKTKPQLQAERQILRELLAGSLKAMGEEDIRPEATPFGHGICRHFALLFAAGAQSPPPALPSTANATERANARTWPLRELDVYLFLDAVIMVLVDESGEKARQAAVEAITIFTETLMLVVKKQIQLTKAPEEKMGPPPSLPVGARDGKAAFKPKVRARLTGDGSIPQVVEELLLRALHCCFRDTWAARLGALHAIRAFISLLPKEYLRARSHLFLRGLFALQRGLPDHATAERAQVVAALDSLLEKILLNGRPPPFKIPETEPGSPETGPGVPPEPSSMGTLGASPLPQPSASAAPAAESPAQVVDVKVVTEPAPATASDAGPQGPAPGPSSVSAPAQAPAAGPPHPHTGQPDAPGSAGLPPLSPMGPAGVRLGDRGHPKFSPAVPTDPKQRMIHMMVQISCQEMMTSRGLPQVRSMAERVLRAVRQLTGQTVADLMSPFLEKVLPSLEKRRFWPFRNIDQHCGVLTVLTFCLRQRPALLTLNSELLTSAVDCQMVVDHLDRPAELPLVLRSASPDQLAAVRLACLSFLSALVQWSAFRDSLDHDHVEKRSRFLHLFFKHLTSSNPDIVEQSEAALKAVATHQRIPKQLLQHSLRPILVNLAYYHKLKLPLLSGLARLLNLLSTWFNVALGEKLIDHMTKWLDPEKMNPHVHALAWEPGEEADIAAAILDLFHLLPPQGSKFLETDKCTGLVVLTIELENALARTPDNLHPSINWSPYRPPLARFLNKYPAEAVNYFLELSRLAKRPYVDRFLDIIQDPIGETLLMQVAASQDRLLALLQNPPPAAAPPAPPSPAGELPQPTPMLSDVESNLLQIVATVCDLIPDWLSPELFTHLHARWMDPARAARMAREAEMNGEQVMESKRLITCMLSYLERNHDQVDALFDTLDVFSSRSRVNFGFLKEHMAQAVLKTYTLEERKKIVKHFLTCFEKKSKSEEHLVAIMKMLIHPLLDAALTAGEEILDAETVASMFDTIFNPNDANLNNDDVVNVELLQLATLIIKKQPPLMEAWKKDLIKFGWNHLKQDDTSAKFYAFLNVCHFLEAYHAPDKVALQVFVALLRTTHSDARKILVRNALDVLTPALIYRIQVPPEDGNKNPMWVRYTRKVLAEENYAMPTLLHTWQLIVRHADMFFSGRANFVNQMVSMIMKIGLHANTGVENKRLALDLAGLVIYWEECRLAPLAPQEETGKSSNMDIEEASENRSGDRKRPRPERTDSEEGLPLAKAQKTGEAAVGMDTDTGDPKGDSSTGESGKQDEGGSAAVAIQPKDAPAAARFDDEFKLSNMYQEVIITFLGKMAFLCSEAKESESQALYWPTLDLLDEAVRVFKGAALKTQYLETLVSHSLASHNESIQPVLIGLEIVTRMLHHQPEEFVSSSGTLLLALVDTVFNTKAEKVLDVWVGMLRKLLLTWKLPTAEKPTNMPKEVMDVFQKMAEYVNNYLTAAQGGPMAVSQNHSALITTIRIMQGVDDLAPEWVAVLVPPLVKFLTKMAHDHQTALLNNTHSVLMSQQPRGHPMQHPLRSRDLEPVPPDYSSYVWIFVEGHRVLRKMLLPRPDQHLKFANSVIPIFHSVQGLKVTDPAVLYCLLESTWEWLVTHRGLASYTEKPSSPIRLLQMLGVALKTVVQTTPYVVKYESMYMELLYRLLTDKAPLPNDPMNTGDQLRRDLFESTEKLFLMGLRCRMPHVRQRFFRLWNEMLPLNSYERLKFIISGQEWEHASTMFWLKFGMDLLLAVLNDDEPIQLAPNSAQMPCLLGSNRPHTYIIRTSQGEIRRTSHPMPTPVAPAAAQQVAPPAVSGGVATAVPVGAAVPNPDAQPAAGPPGPVAQVPGGAVPGQPAPGAPAAGPATSVPAGGAIPLGGPVPNVPYFMPLGPNQTGGGAVSVTSPRTVLQGPAVDTSGTAPAAVPQPPTDPPAANTAGSAPGPPGTSVPGAPLGAAPDAAAPAEAQPAQPNQPMADQPPQPAAPQAEERRRTSPGSSRPRRPRQAAPEQLKRDLTAGIDLSADIDRLMAEHIEFLYKQGGLLVMDLVDCLSSASALDNWIAHQLWVLVFPIVWATLSDKKDQQMSLAKPIILLLSKEYHLRQAHLRPNVIQALLEGISLSQPQPKLPSELLKYLGKTFNAWHCAIPLLESHVNLFNNEVRCSDALAELYGLLNEDDVLVGLWKKRFNAGDPQLQDTKAVITLVQHGKYERAEDWLVHLFRRPLQGETQPLNPNRAPGGVFGMLAKANGTDPGPYDDLGRAAGVGGAPARAELVLWVERYIHCLQEMNHWETITEFANQMPNTVLQAEAAWRLNDLSRLREFIVPNPAPRSQLEDTYRTEVVRAYGCLNDGHVLEADTRYQNAMKLAIESWWQLPEVGYTARLPLLHFTQQLVELSESTRIVLDLSSGRSDPQHNELKELLETWRLRTPNPWDPFATWSSIIVWRCNIYNNVIQTFKTQELGPMLHNLGYREKAWSVNRLGKVALRLGCPDTCIHLIQTMYGYNAMELIEAYSKTRLIAKAYLAKAPDKEQMINGLNTVNSQMFEYFKADMHAEFFRLKALFHEELGEMHDASVLFSVAQRVFPRLPRGWVSWGDFMYRRYCESKLQAGSVPNGGAGSQALIPHRPFDGSVTDIMVCYFQAIRWGSRTARRRIPRMLNLVASDVDGDAAAKAVQSSSDRIPSWVWLPYLPNLMATLLRPNPNLFRNILLALGTHHPQPLYVHLRCFLVTVRDMCGKPRPNSAASAGSIQQQAGEPAGQAAQPSPQGTPATPGPAGPPAPPGAPGAHAGPAGTPPEAVRSPPGQAGGVPGGSNQGQGQEAEHPVPPQGTTEKSPEAIAFDIGKELMEHTRHRYPVRISTLELFLSEIGSKFTSRPEERLLAVVHALLHRCYRLPLGPNQGVPPNLKKELLGVCRACFTLDNVARHGRTMGEFRDGFLAELSPESPTFPHTMQDLLIRLKTWRAVLQASVEDLMPPFLRLEDEARHLPEANIVEVEMPGQWQSFEEVTLENVVHIERIGADVEIVRRHCASFRRLKFYGTDGKARYFLVQTGQHHPCVGSGDDRMLQLMRAFNFLLDKDPQTRRRQLTFFTPVVVNVLSTVRLVEDDPSNVTYGEAYEVNNTRYGREPDLAITHFKKRIAEAGIHGDTIETRLKAYEEIETRLVTESVFSQYMYKTFTAPAHIWCFKRYFCVQLALSAVMQYCMYIGGRTPYKMLFSRSTGRIFQQDFTPLYSPTLDLDKQEAVPFRLTRNLVSFLSSFSIEGSFIAVLSLTAQALLQREDFLKDLLTFYFKEDMNGWALRRPNTGMVTPGVPGYPRPTQSQFRHNEIPWQAIEANVERCLAHFRQMAPYSQAVHENVGGAVNQNAANLAQEAQNVQLLVRMDPTWHPWL